MKKALILMLMLGLMLVGAACSSDDDTPPASNTDIVEDPIVKTDEELNAEAQSVSDALGVNIGLAGEYQIVGYNVNGEDQAQITFEIGEVTAMGRAAIGNVEDLSQITQTFAFNETVEVNGVSAAVHYPDPEELAMYPADSMGYIQAYDSSANITYCVIMLSDATVDGLSAALTDLMNGTSLAAAQ